MAMNSNSNIGCVLYGPRKVVLEKRELEDVGDDEVLLKVGYVGLCGSDLHQYKDAKVGFKTLQGPMVMGHEASGTVLQCGRNVTRLSPGDKLAVEPGRSCGVCSLCKSGRYNLCHRMRFFSSFGPHTDGILCKFKTHPANLCHKLGNNMSLEIGALVEPLSVAVQACRRAHLTPESTVCIFGAGPVGILAALVASHMGVTNIAITDINESRLESANNLVDNCKTVVGSSVQNLINHMQTSFDDMPDVVLECSGAAICLQHGLKVIRRGGTMVCVGIGAPYVNLNPNEIIHKELNIRGVFRYVNCFPLAVEIAGKYSKKLATMITKVFSLQETKEALETALKAEGMKYLIECNCEEDDQ